MKSDKEYVKLNINELIIVICVAFIIMFLWYVILIKK